MAKINQTQRNYMIERLQSSISKKIRSKLKEPEAVPSNSVDSKFRKLAGHSMDMEDIVKHWSDLALLKKLYSSEQKKIDAIVARNEKVAEENNKIRKKYMDLQADLKDELMLGNDLTDLKNVLKKVENA